MFPDLTPDPSSEVDLLDPETFEVPRRLSRDDCRDHLGDDGRRRLRTETEQDDDR